MRGEDAVDRGGGDGHGAGGEQALATRPQGAAAVSGLTAASVLATAAFVAPSLNAGPRRTGEMRARGDLAPRVKSNTKTQRGTPRPLGLRGGEVTGEYEKPIETAVSGPRPVDRDTIPELAALRADPAPAAPAAQRDVPAAAADATATGPRSTDGWYGELQPAEPSVRTLMVIGALLALALSGVLTMLFAGP